MPAAHATDGFGSIRAPAACCGLVGLKPTRARNSLFPYAGEALSGFAAEHAVTRSVRDSAALLDATEGWVPGDPYVAPPRRRPYLEECATEPGRLRIAFTRKAPNGAPVSASSLDALADTARLLDGLGHVVEEVDPAIDGEALVPTFLTVSCANMVINLSTNPARGRYAFPEEVERIVWLTAERGKAISAADYLHATQAQHRIGRQMAAFMSEWDVLLTPGLAEPAVKLGWLDMQMDDFEEYWRRVFHFSPFTVWFNITGQPAMMLPLHETPEHLPVASQFVGRYGDEATLFRLAGQLEKTRPWASRKPPLLVG